MKWLQAAADEIVGCIKKSIEDLDMNDVEKLIGLMIEFKRQENFHGWHGKKRVRCKSVCVAPNELRV